MRLRHWIEGDRFDIGRREILSRNRSGAQTDADNHHALLRAGLHPLIHKPPPVRALLFRPRQLVVPHSQPP